MRRIPADQTGPHTGRREALTDRTHRHPAAETFLALPSQLPCGLDRAHRRDRHEILGTHHRVGGRDVDAGPPIRLREQVARSEVRVGHRRLGHETVLDRTLVAAPAVEIVPERRTAFDRAGKRTRQVEHRVTETVHALLAREVRLRECDLAAELVGELLELRERGVGGRTHHEAVVEAEVADVAARHPGRETVDTERLLAEAVRRIVAIDRAAAVGLDTAVCVEYAVRALGGEPFEQDRNHTVVGDTGLELNRQRRLRRAVPEQEHPYGDQGGRQQGEERNEDPQAQGRRRGAHPEDSDLQEPVGTEDLRRRDDTSAVCGCGLGEVLDRPGHKVTVPFVQSPRSERTGRHGRRAAGGALLVLLVVAVGALLKGRDDGGNDTGTGAALGLMFERCAGATECLERETAKLVGIVGPVDIAIAAAGVYRENPPTVPECHTYLHLLGTNLTPKVRAGNAPELGDAWTECGAGLVHGAFENIGFDPTDTREIADIVALCDGREFAEPLPRHHSCLHAIGHGIHTAVDGDLARGEDLCMRAIPDEANFSRNHPCLAGLYMVDRDERVTRSAIPVDDRGWEELLAHCLESPRPDVCAGSYFETATRRSEREALSYLDWCLTASTETTCLLLLGQGATFRQLFGGQTTLDVTTCFDAAAQRGLQPEACLEGTRQALAANGTPAAKLEDEVCRLFTAKSAPCPTRGPTTTR